jgi:hypothetical protein
VGEGGGAPFPWSTQLASHSGVLISPRKSDVLDIPRKLKARHPRKVLVLRCTSEGHIEIYFLFWRSISDMVSEHRRVSPNIDERIAMKWLSTDWRTRKHICMRFVRKSVCDMSRHSVRTPCERLGTNSPKGSLIPVNYGLAILGWQITHE